MSVVGVGCGGDVAAGLFYFGNQRVLPLAQLVWVSAT